MNQNLNETQIQEITERVEKAVAYLKENDLMPGAQVSIVNTGNNCFQNRVDPYLQDVRYTKIEGNQSAENSGTEYVPPQSENSSSAEFEANAVTDDAQNA